METPKSSPQKILTTSLPHPTRIGRRHCLPLVIVLLYLIGIFTLLRNLSSRFSFTILTQF